VGRRYLGNALAGREPRLAMKLPPPTEDLVASSKNPRRHQRLFIRVLRLSLKVSLPEIHPRPIRVTEFGIAAFEISRLKENVGIDEKRVFRPDRAQGKIGRLTKSERAFRSDRAQRSVASGKRASRTGTIIDEDNFGNETNIGFERTEHVGTHFRVVMHRRCEG